MGASWNCPVCSANCRDEVVDAIVLHLRMSGSFSISSIASFWTVYCRNLCDACEAQVREMSSARNRALALLAEAVKLDPSNSAAKKNLDTLKSVS